MEVTAMPAINSETNAASVVQVENLSVDLLQNRVTVNDVPVALTHGEYTMLNLLAQNKGKTVTKEMFLLALYGLGEEPELKVLDVFICKINKKLTNASMTETEPNGKTYITPVWGRGHILGKPDTSVPNLSTGEPTKPRPKYVIGPDGRPLTIGDLPRMDKRWVIRRKAEVVVAVRGGLLSLDEACARYAMLPEELFSWGVHIDRHGLAGLRTTRTQQYR